jgi:hypothetical protein
MPLRRKNKGLNLTVLAFKDSMQPTRATLQRHWDLPTPTGLAKRQVLGKKRLHACQIFRRIHAGPGRVLRHVHGNAVAMPQRAQLLQ